MKNQQEAVVLIHGLAGGQLVLIPLCMRMGRRWKNCRSWSYSSWRYTIKHHADLLLRYHEENLSAFHRVHVVAHSMGAIVYRAALAERPFSNLGRTVFLGPPHHGTPMADKFCDFWGQQWKTIADLKSGNDSYVNRLPDWSYGEACTIRAEGDFLIPPERTVLDGIQQYASVPGPHSYLLFSARAARMAEHFLMTGQLQNDLDTELGS